MERTNKLICPSCGAALKSVHSIRFGKKIKCLKCGVAFTVRPEDAQQAERAGGINPGRLGIVLAVAILYLLGGAGLAYYCFATNAPRSAVVQTGSGSLQAGKEDEDSAAPPMPLPSGPAAVSTAEQRQIDNAIAKGVWFLKDYLVAKGTWGDAIPDGNGGHTLAVGFTALPGLTLLECGVPANDPIVQKAAALVRTQAKELRNIYDTYQRALAILFLDRLGEDKDRELIQYLALCLIAGQRVDDYGWGYNCPTLTHQETPKLLQGLRDYRQPLNQWRQTALNGGAFDPGRSDNSNTQFAILALWVAGRPKYQVPIDRTIALVEKRFRTTQMVAPGNPDMDGAWPYNPETGLNNNPWRTMTCAGLLGLAIAQGVTDDAKAQQAKPLDDPAIKKGLAVLGGEIDQPGDERKKDLYFLWSLQRVGVLYNLPKIGNKDWYAWGRKWLLAKQKPAGNWEDGAYYGNNPILDTCFALLFLKQANLAKDLTNKLQLLASLTANVPRPNVPMPVKKE